MAAGGCVAGDGQIAVESREAALVAAPKPMCRVEDGPSPLVLSVAGGDAADLTLSDASHLVVDVQNDRGRDADATLWARSLSELGAARVVAARFAVPANGAATVSVDPGSLDLPKSALEFSGSLALWAEATYAEGHRWQSPRLHVYFHPTADGWRVYGRSVRDASFDGGALTAAARELRASPMAAGAGVVIRSPVRTLSDSTDYQPPLEAPVDSL